MLKLTYTENGFHLEHLAQSLEDWVTTRVILALRTGTHLYVEPTTASLMLPRDLPDLADLETVIEKADDEMVELSVCDEEYVEVTLQGTWLASTPKSEEGIFVCVMSDRAEFFLYQLWQAAEAHVAVISE